jgi:hypothetical protein
MNESQVNLADVDLVLKLAVVLFGLTYVHPMFLIGVGTNYM